jgi:hypothetical protein
MRFSLPILLLISVTAGGREPARPEKGPTSSAAEIPALAALLVKGQWNATPELSGRYNVGTIIDQSKGDHRIVARGCFARPAVVSPYIGAELVASMQAGVSVRLGLGSASGSGEVIKKVKFGTPTTESLESLYMQLSGECEKLLLKQAPDRLAQMYVVQEVLKAEIAEQSCGRVDASGRFVGLGSAEVEYSQACSQETLEPVVVGYRTVPLVEVLPPGVARDGTLAASERGGVVAVAAPVPPPTTVTGPPAAARVDAPTSAHEFSGSHVGVFLGLQNGLRYRYVFADGRRSLGFRAEAGLTLYYGYSPYPFGAGALEFETRRDPGSNVGLLIDVGGGYPGYVQAGAAAVFGKPVGRRLELGVDVGYPVLTPRVAFGWVW